MTGRFSHLAGAATLASLALCPIPMGAFSALGVVEPDWEATLATVILGRVEDIEVEEGDTVEAGTVLVRLDSEMERLDLQRRKLVAENQVELELAKAKLEVMEPAFERTSGLYRSGSLSQDEYDRSSIELRLAQAEYAQLQEREEIERLEMQLAEEQVARRVIRAPRRATVIEIFPEEGEVCEPRQPVVRLLDASTVDVVLEIDSEQTSALRQGVPVQVQVMAPGGMLDAEGLVHFVSPAVDAASGLRHVRVRIDNSDGRILPGLTATVTFDSLASAE